MKAEIKSLTGLRGVAAFIVVLYHFGEPYNTLGIDTHFRIPQGYLAVDLFFVLSGFVLSYTYADYFAERLTAEKFRHFLIRRIARLYPAYLVIMVLYLAKMAFNFAGINPFEAYRLSDISGNLFMLTGWGMGVKPVIGDSWSVSAEVAAYLLFPILVTVTVFGRRSTAVAAALVAGGTLVAVAATGLGVKGPMDVVLNSSPYPLLRCIAGFSIGLLAFRTWRSQSARRCLSGNLATCIILFISGACLIFHAHDLIVLGCFPAFVVILSCQSAIARTLFANRIVIWLGEVSYSLYLVHIICVSTAVRMAKLVQLRFGVDAYWLMTIAGVAIACGLAWASYQWIEMPGKRIVLGLVRARRARPV